MNARRLPEAGGQMSPIGNSDYRHPSSDLRKCV